ARHVEQPDVGPGPPGREVERRRHDADHLVLLAVEPESVPHDSGIGAEALPPQSFRDHGDLRLAGLVLRRIEDAAEPRAAAENREQVWRGLDRADALGLARPLEVGAPPPPRRELLEACLLLNPV